MKYFMDMQSFQDWLFDYFGSDIKISWTVDEEEEISPENQRIKKFVYKLNKFEGVGMKLSGLPKDLMTVLFGGHDFTAEKTANWEVVKQILNTMEQMPFDTVLV